MKTYPTDGVAARRLCNATLKSLPADIAYPTYDRSKVRNGVVHLGLGAFHRAHQAVVFDRALLAGDLRWGVTGVCMTSVAVRNALAAQDGLYTVHSQGAQSTRVHCVGALKRVLVATESPAAVVLAMSDPEVHIVTLTVTEKGYHLDPGTGVLDFADPAVIADLTSPQAPTSVVGFLVAALAVRRSAGIAPFTTLSCDNLSCNGDKLKAAVVGLAAANDPALAAWIDSAAAFPNTMVDRIVPATTPDDIAELQARAGLIDLATVKTEPFLQWVIEDRFCGPSPDFEQLGGDLTSDIRPWETVKLRMLNGAHSAVAYLAGLLGIRYVHEAVAEPAFRAFIKALWDETAETLTIPEQFDIAQYRQALLQRLLNSTLRHETMQIACDGSQKMPVRLIHALGMQAASGGKIDALSLAVAGWIKWLGGETEVGRPITIVDPRKEELRLRLACGGRGSDPVERLLELDWLMPRKFALDPRVRGSLKFQFDQLNKFGVRGALERNFAT